MKHGETAFSELPPDLQHERVRQLIDLSLREDLATEDPLPAEIVQLDVTSAATIPPGAMARAQVFTRQAGVIAGLGVASAVFRRVDPAIRVQFSVHDGDGVKEGTELLTASGPGRALLLAERTALNFLARMSGVASFTRAFVEAVSGTGTVVLDTRKTMPGYRLLDKYAVRMGGGCNHRMGLYDMVLIKDNHVDAAGGVRRAVEAVLATHGHRLLIEVEVRSLKELEEVLDLPVDRILLDNMRPDEMRRAVQITAGRIPLEASGNVRLDTIRSVAETGVDFISIGALTHSAPALNVSMQLE